MANFQAHLSIAAVASGLAATACLSTGIVSQTEAIFLWSAGIFGGILPDVDSKNSTSLQIVFTFFAAMFAFLAAFHHINTFSIVELWMVWGAAYAFVRYFIIAVFKKITLHRGNLHSLMAALLFALSMTVISFRLLGASAVFAWLLGIFAGLGFAIHLLLDEANSIEIKNNIRLKRSFGTAIKLFDKKRKVVSFLMIIGLVLMFFLTPDPTPLKKLADPIKWRFFPERQWF